MTTISTELAAATRKLKGDDLENARFEAEILLSLATKKTRETILTHPETELSEDEAETFREFVSRRSKHEPFSHISGEKEFMGFSFIVTTDTLIPRPETEILVEHASAVAQKFEGKNILIADIGTGSGCIAISTANLLREKHLLSPATSFVAIDISKEALAVCRRNIGKHSLDGVISVFNGDLLLPVIEKEIFQGNEVFIALANLPYLSAEIYASSPKTVQDFEPKSALFSKEQGLSHYRRLLEQILQIKKANPKMKIFALLEISPEQRDLFSNLAASIMGDKKIKLDFFQDLAGKWRLVKLEIL
ncbi:peptide chain release factor N(5)-glutamine methyltransferase [bacterium]|jgi:release factor glutamine methyltransferase|nr:peptide chain release factor N(5)-glutamine methyltransferase [bacterium]MBT4251377.1 peptide chain release factor N(5)-glutamine methyltransferase [bacterium]MBT4598242.1 peptide chain release factor N(5)-glutamine methyltransferase [bacterium]MBT6754075.1 peptide chain release factor N(5)-glutamine methyltransferase [bacterium]MBT7037895.1 peptide chain release factor N(5)-glutamine methyltransferase [bacterium]